MDPLLSLLFSAFLTWNAFKLAKTTAHTSANAARCFGIFAAGFSILAAIAQNPFLELPRLIQGALQYLAATLFLTPWIAVLGARRPGAAAWPWFVVMPLVVVLQWPCISQLLESRTDAALEIPTPTMVGFCFVLLMGVGNYFGTLNTTAAAIAGAGILLFVMPVTEWSVVRFPWLQAVGCGVISLGLWRGRKNLELLIDSVSRGDEETGQAQQLWLVFREMFGIVWAKRVADRVNQFAERERWTVRLSLDGFVADELGEPADEKRKTSGVLTAVAVCNSNAIPDRAVEILCWVLRRFVDKEFVQQFLPNFTTEQPAMDNRLSSATLS